MTNFKPTAQQEQALEAFSTGEGVGISAGAGCGKTATLQMMAQSTQERGLLLCFNRAVADEASKKLRGTRTDAKNTHRLAYAWAMGNKQGRNVIGKIQTTSRIRRDQTARAIGITPTRIKGKLVSTPTLTELAIETLHNFMRSDDDTIQKKHLAYVKGLEEQGVTGRGPIHKELTPQVLDYARDIWKEAIGPHQNVRVSHDVYLKLWALSKPVLPYSHILLDECQDTNGAVFGVFDAQEAQKIFVGDANQQLFAWNGSLNIMDRLDAPHHVQLTKSWRFGKAIEDSANAFLDLLKADIRLEGNPAIASRVEPGAVFDASKSSAVLTRTNAGAVQALIEAQNNGEKAYLIGGAGEVIRLIREAEKLRQGKSSNHPDLVAFESWASLKVYVNEDPDAGDLALIVKLIERFGASTIIKNLEQMESRESDAQTVISTVHKVKGREWEQVRLAEDFSDMVEKAEARKGKKKGRKAVPYGGFTREELMIAYVAVTRAKSLLDPGAFEEQLKAVIDSSPVTPPVAPQQAPVAPQGLFGDISLPNDIQGVLGGIESRTERDALIEQVLREGFLARGLLNARNSNAPF